MMALRQCANHPYLIENIRPTLYVPGQHLIDASAKMIALNELLIAAKTDRSRVLIFSQFTQMLDILEDYCKWRPFTYCRLDGSTSNRNAVIEQYCEPNSNIFIFLLSTHAGGAGINLIAADIVVMYDADWNPQNDSQAIDRSHRIGQTKQVKVFKLITNNTIDDNMQNKGQDKLDLSEQIVDGNMLP